MSERVLIDTDPGIDDAAAIMLALASPEIEVVGVTAVAGNLPVEGCAANALRILAVCERDDIPVHAGMDRPLVIEQVFSRQTPLGTWTDDLMPPSTGRVSEMHAVDAIAAAAERALSDGVGLTVCAVAPLTNIAMALLRYPHVRRGLSRIVMMGGAFTALGMRTPWAEFNVYADPHAAHVVFGSGVPIVLFPLDVTCQALLGAAMVERLAKGAGWPAQAMARLLRAMDRDDPRRFGGPGAPLHDAMPLAWLVRPDLFSLAPAGVRVVTDGATIGQTYADFLDFFGAPPSVQVARTVDGAAYLDLVVSRIESLG